MQKLLTLEKQAEENGIIKRKFEGGGVHGVRTLSLEQGTMLSGCWCLRVAVKRKEDSSEYVEKVKIEFNCRSRKALVTASIKM